jgi:predicted adenine nucleotide alpha hydrolase (AANH) superfamily ATPase
VWPVRDLRAKGYDVTTMWFNPNVHPAREYQARLAAFRQYARSEGVPATVEEGYALPEFLRRVWRDAGEPPARCLACYSWRLAVAAEAAALGGFDCFSTTLLASPHQRHNDIARVGAAAGSAAGVRFLHIDWRTGFRAGQASAKAMGLYRQAYCGCVFSEADAYFRRGPSLVCPDGRQS